MMDKAMGGDGREMRNHWAWEAVRLLADRWRGGWPVVGWPWQ